MFDSGWGQDTIQDFTNGVDRIDLSGTAVTGLDQLAITQFGSYVEVRYGADIIYLAGFSAVNLDATDFIFATPLP